MIGWLAPLALFGLIAIAGPIVVHLLRRQRAKRIQFPSIRTARADRCRPAACRGPMASRVRVAVIA